MSTNSFILVLMRKMALSIAVIGMAIACRSKTSDSETDLVNRRDSAGQEDSFNKKNDLYDDDDDEVGLKRKNIKAGDEVKKEVNKKIEKDDKGNVKKTTTVTKTNKKDGSQKVTTKTEETKKDMKEDEDEKMQNEDEEDEDEDEEEEGKNKEEEEEEVMQEEKTFGVDVCSNSWSWYKPWSWSWFKAKRLKICSWPANYETSVPINPPYCCKKLNKRARKVAQKTLSKPKKAQEIACATGAFSNPTAADTCKIEGIGVVNFKNRNKWLNRGWFRKCRSVCREKAKGCGFKCKNDDRFLVLSFIRKSFFRRWHLRWDDPCCKLLDKLNDFRSGKNEWPKIKVDKIARFEAKFDPNKDECDKDGNKYEYRIKQHHYDILCLLPCSKKIKKKIKLNVVDDKGMVCCKEIEYPNYETQITPYCYMGYNRKTRCLGRSLMSRDGLLFYEINGGPECKKPCQVYDCDTCPKTSCETGEEGENETKTKEGIEIEDTGMNHKSYMKLRNKGVNAEKGYKKLHPSWFNSAVRAVYIEKCDCKGKRIKWECLYRVSYIYRIQVWEKEGAKPIVYNVNARP